MAASDAGQKPDCFKAYDIRGEYPAEIDERFAYSLGEACGSVFSARKVVMGWDSRLSSPNLASALASGLNVAGIQTDSLGLCGTEEIYHAAAGDEYDLAIMITGSHNPADQNGFKFVRAGAIPVSSKSGLNELATRMKPGGNMAVASAAREISLREDYIRWLCQYVPFDHSARPLRVLANAGNGCAGLVLQELSRYLPIEFVPLNYTPDGTFPNGIPNPLLSDNRAATSLATRKSGADVGVAFDGDFDRCFFFDEDGKFIEGYYIVGLLASSLLKDKPREKIIHDPRLYWNTQAMVRAAGGIPIMGRTGHAYMKEKMREVNALYGGEMSAHHYFRDFAYCDSGMLTMLLVLRYLQDSQRTLGELAASSIASYPCSGERNFRCQDPNKTIHKIWQKFVPASLARDQLDGINLEFKDWRFNLRSSNTEPLLRLNMETKGSLNLLEDKLGEVTALIDGSPASS